MIFQMATVEKSILIETFMKGNGKMEKDMEKEHLKIVMEWPTVENGIKTTGKAKDMKKLPKTSHMKGTTTL